MKKIYLIAAVIALAAGVATYFFATELQSSKIVTGVDEASVVVAIADIDENTVLTAEMLQEIKLPVNAVTYGTVCNIKDIIGYTATEKIFAGEQLMVRKIANIGKSEPNRKLSYELSNGKYAYTIYVAKENAVSYYIKEYDKINVYSEINAELVLENVTVLRIGDYSAWLQQETGTEINTFEAITLEVTKEQITKLMELENADTDQDKNYRFVLVSHAEAYGIADKIENAAEPGTRSDVPQTNYGMGEITTAPPETE